MTQRHDTILQPTSIPLENHNLRLNSHLSVENLCYGNCTLHEIPIHGRRSRDRYQSEDELWESYVFDSGYTHKKEGNPMARRYTLDTKIHALNLLDEYDDDLVIVSQELNIPAMILNRWRIKEDDLRRDHQQKLRSQFVRLKAELQVEMLERGKKIIACMDDETLEKAPLNQLATALGSLVNHALKLDEASEDTDEQTEEKIVRFEYYYNGSLQDAPPWAGTSEGLPRKVQSGGVRKTMGQNGTGKNDTDGERYSTPDAWLVADSDVSDVESGLAGFEDEFEERDWYHD